MYAQSAHGRALAASFRSSAPTAAAWSRSAEAARFLAAGPLEASDELPERWRFWSSPFFTSCRGVSRCSLEIATLAKEPGGALRAAKQWKGRNTRIVWQVM